MRTNKLHVQRNLFMLLFCNKIQIYHDKLAKTRLKFIQNETNKLASEVELFCYLLNIGITIVENYFIFLIFSSVEEVKGIPEHRVATGRLLFVICTSDLPYSFVNIHNNSVHETWLETQILRQNSFFDIIIHLKIVAHYYRLNQLL